MSIFSPAKVVILKNLFGKDAAKFKEEFLEWSKNLKSSKKIKIINDLTNSNETRLGAIGDIDFAVRNEKIDDDILVIAGDNLFEFSLLHLYNFYKNNLVLLLQNLVLLEERLDLCILSQNSKLLIYQQA